MRYKINEIFSSIQGEGAFSGTPVVFLRLAGCSMGCSFCDTKYCQKVNMKMDEEQIVQRIGKDFPNFDRVVITGGEPFEQNIFPLIEHLLQHNIKVNIETNGAQQYPLIQKEQLLLSECWITVSPKHHWDEQFVGCCCDEMKFVVSHWQDVYNALNFKTRHVHKRCYLQPESNKKENIKLCVDACLKFPTLFQLSVQMHKLIEVR